MLVIILVLVAAVLVAFVVGIKRFNYHCALEFGHAFFAKRAFYFTAAAIGVYAIGQMWRSDAQHAHGDTLNGIALMGIGALIAAWRVCDQLRAKPRRSRRGRIARTPKASWGLSGALAAVPFAGWTISMGGPPRPPANCRRSLFFAIYQSTVQAHTTTPGLQIRADAGRRTGAKDAPVRGRVPVRL